MKTKVYGHLTREVGFHQINKTLEKYGSDGYRLVSVLPIKLPSQNDHTGGTYLLFLEKEYTERD